MTQSPKRTTMQIVVLKHNIIVKTYGGPQNGDHGLKDESKITQIAEHRKT